MTNHYIRTNESEIIIHGFSDAFEQPQEGDILILEDGPRHFHLAWPEPLTNERGQYRFRWIDGQRVEKTQTELDAEWEASAPSRYRELRRAAYPPIGDQLDALWKWLEPPEGTEAAEMRARWLAVKQQYLKPNEGGEHAE